MIGDLYPTALDHGIPPERFWNYSLGEVLDLIESWVRVKKQTAKEQIAAYFELAGLIGLYIQKPYDEKNEIKIPHPWDAYPDLYQAEKERYEAAQEKIMLNEARISRREYAQKHNRLRNQGLI